MLLLVLACSAPSISLGDGTPGASHDSAWSESVDVFFDAPCLGEPVTSPPGTMLRLADAPFEAWP
jgi:hypothetical protein